MKDSPADFVLAVAIAIFIVFGGFMKTFLIGLVIAAAMVGSAGIGYVFTGKYYEAEFHLITNLDWNDFKDYSAKCEELYNEPCGIYGGFAPKAQIKNHQ